MVLVQRNYFRAADLSPPPKFHSRCSGGIYYGQDEIDGGEIEGKVHPVWALNLVGYQSLDRIGPMIDTLISLKGGPCRNCTNVRYIARIE